MSEAYTIKEIEERLEHEKYLRKENQELYEELQVLRKCSDGTNDLANEYKNRIDKAIEYIRIYRSYQKIDNKDYLKGRDEIGCLDIYQVDELLDILNEVSE